jgi:uncharacterized protein (DUF885 family)
MRWWVCLGLIGLCGCASAPVAVPTAPVDGGAALQALGDEFWEANMRRYPTWATHMGDRRFDDRLEDLRPEAVAAWQETLRGLLSRVEALDEASLSPSERITAEVLEEELRARTSTAVCQEWRWVVDQLNGPQVTLVELPSGHPIRSPQDAWTLVARVRAVGPALRQHAQNLREGRGDGLIAPRINVERVIRQVEALLEAPQAQSPWWVVPRQRAQEAGLHHEALRGPQGEVWEEALAAAIREEVYPGLEALLAVLRDELLPRARLEPGISALPGGAACYEALKRAATGSDQSAAALHQIGLDEVARIRKEMLTLIGDDLGGQPLGAWLRALGASPEQGFESPEALLEYNRGLVARAQVELPRAFGRLPKTPLEVWALEGFREQDAPAAYYFSAPADGSRPAVYYVNTFEPQKRPRYTMAVLAFHEAVPGHHLQIALASEQGSLPIFQRELGQTAFVEGWALYSERLAGELGLYQTRDERLGALVFEMWRAVRLVVDTGMHTQGWSRQRALDYLIEHTGKDQGGGQQRDRPLPDVARAGAGVQGRAAGDCGAAGGGARRAGGALLGQRVPRPALERGGDPDADAAAHDAGLDPGPG